MTEVKKTQMRTMWTIELIKIECEKHGFQLVSTKYVNSSTKIDIICSCGRPNSTVTRSIVAGMRCKGCYGEKAAMKNKHSYEYVKDLFKIEGCELLSTEYVNNRTKLNYICKCGEPARATLDKFKKGQRCMSCGKKELSEARKTPFDEVKQTFIDAGCLLLSEKYVNSQAKLSYVCSCGETNEIAFSKFKMGQRCFECGVRKTADARRRSIGEIRSIFEELGCALLSTEYKGTDSPLRFTCGCGEMGHKRISDFMKSPQCIKCGNSERVEISRYKLDEVVEMFAERGCKFSDESYTNSKTLLNYICSCGNPSRITLEALIMGRKCSNCRESKGEMAIREFLQKFGLKFYREHKFSDCRNTHPLPFDFLIQMNSSLPLIVEYDGIQHFQEIEFFGGEVGYKNTMKNDNIKSNYCINNDIPLIRIPYWELDNIEYILFDALVEHGIIESISA